MRIPARSRRQMMEWSLVLASQGIDPVLEGNPHDSTWALLVRDEEYEKALQALRLYQAENRGWPWQRTIFQEHLLFDWASLAWVILCALFFIFDPPLHFREHGIMDSTAVAQGQWWRLFTAILLHADIAHLVANLTIGLVLLGLAMARYGTGPGLLASYLAGAGGNLLAWIVMPARGASLGASGMVMGSLGLLAVQSIVSWRNNPRAAKTALVGILAGLMLFLILGISPGTDVLAHLGGFISGLLLGAILSLLPAFRRNPIANLGSALLFAVLVIIPWRLARTH